MPSNNYRQRKMSTNNAIIQKSSTTTQDIGSMKGAPLWRRFAAMIYDSFVIIAISMAYGGIATAIVAITSEDPRSEVQSPMFSSPLFGLGWALTIMCFYCIFWRRFGQTIGMKTWHIRLYALDQSQQELSGLSWKHCFLRSAFGICAFACCGAGYLFGFIDNNGDCWHDKMSKTRVIFTKDKKPQK